MHPSDQYEREEEALQQSFERGEIDRKTLMHELQELARDYRAAAREAAQEASEREMERW